MTVQVMGQNDFNAIIVFHVYIKYEENKGSALARDVYKDTFRTLYLVVDEWIRKAAWQARRKFKS